MEFSCMDRNKEAACVCVCVAIAKLKLELKSECEWNDKENAMIVEIIAGHETELMSLCHTYVWFHFACDSLLCQWLKFITTGMAVSSCPAIEITRGILLI